MSNLYEKKRGEDVILITENKVFFDKQKFIDDFRKFLIVFVIVLVFAILNTAVLRRIKITQIKLLSGVNAEENFIDNSKTLPNFLKLNVEFGKYMGDQYWKLADYCVVLGNCGIDAYKRRLEHKALMKAAVQTMTEALLEELYDAQVAAMELAEEAKEAEKQEATKYSSGWDGSVLTPSRGVVWGPTGKETYYNLDMSGVISIMRDMGYSEEEYPYWVRDDGVKMLGDYVMVAANLSVYPRGSLVPCSLGTGIVCDTGGFAVDNPNQLDIATAW